MDSNETKLNRKKLPKRARNLSKEQLLKAIKKKKETDTKAQSIVIKLLEPSDNGEEFIEYLKHINQCHYQDIVEERAITKICGYPLCNNELGIILTQTYKISTVSNKVYDLTERKNFCSGKCFKASNYLKEQLLTSPLWLRDLEDIPEFKLLSLD